MARNTLKLTLWSPIIQSKIEIESITISSKEPKAAMQWCNIQTHAHYILVVLYVGS